MNVAASDPEYIQLSSWEELCNFIEIAQKKVFGPDWAARTSPPKRKRKKRLPPQEESLF